MMPTTSLALVLIGVAGALRCDPDAGHWARLASKICAAVVLVVGVATVLEYALNLELHIDEWLLPGPTPGPHPGRPSPLTAFALSSLASALLSLDASPQARFLPPQWFVMAAVFSGLVAMTGQILGVGPLYRFSRESVQGVAVHTVLGLLLASAGLLFARPQAGLLRIVTSRGPGGTLLRRLLLPALLAPFAFELVVTVLLDALGIEDSALVTGTLMTAAAVVAPLVLVLTAKPLDRAHEALARSREENRSLSPAQLTRRVAVRDPRKLSIATPLEAHALRFGALTLLSTDEQRRYGQEDLAFATDLGRRLALALDNARLFELATRAVRMRDEVLSVVAHDLRNPIGTISLAAATLLHHNDERLAVAHRIALRIERSAARASRLIDDLLDITRIERTGGLVVEPQPVSVERLAADVVEAYEPLAAEARVELEVELSSKLPPVRADEARVVQVLGNLPRVRSLLASGAQRSARRRTRARDRQGHRRSARRAHLGREPRRSWQHVQVHLAPCAHHPALVTSPEPPRASSYRVRSREGPSSSSFLGRELAEFAAPEQQSVLRDAAQHVLEGEPFSRTEVRGAVSEHWFDLTLVGVRERGNTTGLVVYATDIEEQKQRDTEQAWLRAQLHACAHGGQPAATRPVEGFELMADALPVLIAYVDAELRYRYNNASYERWFGRARSELAGRRMDDVLGADAYAELQSYVEAALAGRAVSLETSVSAPVCSLCAAARWRRNAWNESFPSKQSKRTRRPPKRSSWQAASCSRSCC